MAVMTWLLVAKFSRYSSLASLVTTVLAPLYAIVVTEQIGYFIPLIFITLLIAYKHNSNITRLMDGNEPKIQLKGPLLEDLMEVPPHEQMSGVVGAKVSKAKTAVKKSAPKAKKPATKKPAAKKPAAKKPAAKKPAAKKTAKKEAK
jgi:glycerol-3-phosphate acyltransferase PlsY